VKGIEPVKRAAQSCAPRVCRSSSAVLSRGDDIGAGAVDVVVTDGFTANVALKTAEGTAEARHAFI
jgi:glycerol-3-phosphate acyltransferase PlsX